MPRIFELDCMARERKKTKQQAILAARARVKPKERAGQHCHGVTKKSPRHLDCAKLIARIWFINLTATSSQVFRPVIFVIVRAHKVVAVYLRYSLKINTQFLVYGHLTNTKRFLDLRSSLWALPAIVSRTP